MPELLWKAYIDAEYDEGNYGHARALYERLLQRSQHIKVWVSYANFEASVPAAMEADGEAEDEAKEPTPIERARAVLERAAKALARREGGASSATERTLLFEAWIEIEEAQGEPDREQIARIAARMPRKVTRRRKVPQADAASPVAWEEYTEYLFPDDDVAGGSGSSAPASKLLAMAHQWKKQAQGEKDAPSAT